MDGPVTPGSTDPKTSLYCRIMPKSFCDSSKDEAVPQQLSVVKTPQAQTPATRPYNADMPVNVTYVVRTALKDFDIKQLRELLKTLSNQLGAKGEENLKIIMDVLDFSSHKVQDENAMFVVMVMSVMLIESTMDSDQQNKVTGADGIMQLLKKTAMGVLANLEPNNDADKKILYVLEPYLKQAAGLSETIRDIHNNLVESTKIYIRPNSTLQKANPAKEAMRIKIEIADKQKHLKNQRDNILIPKAVELLRKTELLKVPTLSIALGVLYLAQLCEKNKDSSGVVDLKGALNDYSGSEKSNFYFPRIMTMMKIVSEYTGAVPLMVTENVHERLNIETALKLVMKDPAFLQEIIDHKRTPDDGIRYLKALVKFENAEKEANRAVEATSEQKPKIEIVAVKTKHVVRHKVTPHTATANHRHHPASQARHVSHRKNH